MNANMLNQKKNTAVWPEKLYTQREVDGLLQNKEDSLAPAQSTIAKDIQLTANNKKLNKNLVAGLVRKSNRILASITTHAFPFDLFPDVINIEEGRITVIARNFFSSQVHSVDIKDISNIFINMAPFFAQLVIISKTFSENEIRIRNLRKNEAILARRIIEGLRIFENKKIDTSSYTRGELIAKLQELSTTEIVT